MDDLCERFPLVAKMVLNNLDDQSLTNCKIVNRKLNNFIENERFYWIRILKKYVLNFVSFSDSWRKVIKKAPIEIVKELAIASQEFF